MAGPHAQPRVQHFLQDVRWGDDLDYLLIDMPPGTGDVQMGVAKLLPRAEVIVVTTPARAAQKVAERAVGMARKSYLRVAGVVENMSAFQCEHGGTYALFGEGGGEQLAHDAGVPCWASPAGAVGVRRGRHGRAGGDWRGPAAEAFRAIADHIRERRSRWRPWPAAAPACWMPPSPPSIPPTRPGPRRPGPPCGAGRAAVGQRSVAGAGLELAPAGRTLGLVAERSVEEPGDRGSGQRPQPGQERGEARPRLGVRVGARDQAPPQLLDEHLDHRPRHGPVCSRSRRVTSILRARGTPTAASSTRPGTPPGRICQRPSGSTRTIPSSSSRASSTPSGVSAGST